MRSATVTGLMLRLAVVTALLGWTPGAVAGGTEGQSAIKSALLQIRDAAIASDPDRTAPIFAENLTLVSQSGKLYGKEAALFDLRNGFITWDNSDIVVREQGDTAIVTLVNNRTRAGMEPAEFRVLQVWRKSGDGWVLAAQSSVAVKSRPATVK